MEITCATRPGGHLNEDVVVTGGHFAVVIDGATPEPGTDNGCHHTVSWLVRMLGGRLAAGLMQESDDALTWLLRNALTEVNDAHGPRCDLTNPRSPSATLAILRRREHRVEYLVLGDSAVAVQFPDKSVEVVVDKRMEGFPELSWADLRHLRNKDDGFWVAGNSPAAADHAFTGDFPAGDVVRAGLFTDGAYRLVERYGWQWGELLDCVASEGGQALIARTRAAEATTPAGTFPGKPFDDATVALCVPRIGDVSCPE